MLLGLYLSLALATLTGSAVAWVLPGYRPLAAFLLLAQSASLARTALVGEGGQSLFLVSLALYLLDPLGLAAAALIVFGRAKWALVVLGGWVALVAGLAIGGAGTEEPSLRRVLLRVQIAALAVVGAAWIGRAASGASGGALARTSIVLIAAIELVVLLVGPWPRGLWTRWDLAQVAYCVLYATLTVLHVGYLWIAPKATPAP